MKLKYTYAILLASLSSYAYSQDVYNTTSVFIPNSISIHIDDLHNFGFIQNNGTIEATGDWKNRMIYQGLGTISLAGADQEIDNNKQAIQNLLVDGGGTKTLDEDLEIKGSLELVSGILKVDENNTLLIDNDATIEGGSSLSFVDGPLDIEGTGYKFFPVGHNGNYYPVTLTEIRGLNPVIRVNAKENFPDVETERDVEVNVDYYWTQEVVSGSYAGSPVMIQHNSENEKAAFISADDLKETFDVVEAEEAGTGSIVSKKELKKTIIAFGNIPPDPIQPGYLSTSMSPHAMNPDNRLIKFFGTEASDTNFSLKVFNRWGNLMFESNSLSAMISEGWDGRHDGQYLPAGAYPYKLSYVDQEGREGNKTGFITIIY
jgi:gliding motility-associated-like protein